MPCEAPDRMKPPQWRYFRARPLRLPAGMGGSEALPRVLFALVLLLPRRLVVYLPGPWLRRREVRDGEPTGAVPVPHLGHPPPARPSHGPTGRGLAGGGAGHLRVRPRHLDASGDGRATLSEPLANGRPTRRTARRGRVNAD